MNFKYSINTMYVQKLYKMNEAVIDYNMTWHKETQTITLSVTILICHSQAL